MPTSIHFSFEQLTDFVEGRLASGAIVEIETHLASGCTSCLLDAALLRRMQRAWRAESWPAPPAHVHRRAIRAFRSAHQPSWVVHLSNWRWRIATLVVVVILISLAGNLKNASSRYTAVLSNITGPVMVRLKPNTAWQSLANGQTFSAGMEIRTGEGGQAAIVFPGGDRLQIMSDTHLTLKTLARRSGRWQIGLIQTSGQTYNQVEPGTNRYWVQTPAGEAVANGTRFMVNVATDGTTLVSVSKGLVTVTAAHKVVSISAGQEVRFAQGSAPTVLRPSPSAAAPTIPPPTASLVTSPTLPSATPSPNTPTLTPAPTRTPEPSDIDVDKESEK